MNRLKNTAAALLIALTSLTVANTAMAQQAPATAPAVAPAPAADEMPMLWKGIAGGVLLGLVGLFVFRMFKRKDTPANPSFTARQPSAPAATPEIASRVATPPAPPAAVLPPGMPADFDQAAFLVHAKASFVRMQAAWDKGDTVDLQAFTTPQVFDELSQQIQGQGDVAVTTEVVTIDAELLGMQAIGNDQLASVKFVGLLKSAPQAEAAPFAEVWNMSRPLAGNSGWLLAGIQQLS